MSNQSYEAARKAAEKRIKNRVEFYQHIAAYVIINTMLALAFRDQWWIIFPIFGWGLGVILHGLEVFLDDPLRRERAIEREMRKLGFTATDVEAEKPKRGERVALSEDGELIYEEADEYEEKEAPRRRRQRS